jgi:hypothetical protein
MAHKLIILRGIHYKHTIKERRKMSKNYKHHKNIGTWNKKHIPWNKGKRWDNKTLKKMRRVMHRLIKLGKISKYNRHHIDLNPKNNREDNKLKLTRCQHRRCHLYAYNYLVKIGRIKEYMKWFIKNKNKKLTRY